tara:strand:- start:3759 stop:4484 length:726 start_codon:yes stop_codon:yes gene_type:complete
MAVTRGPKPVLSTNLTDAVEGVLNDAVDAGVDFNDIENDNTPKIRAKYQRTQEGLDDLVALKSQGSAIPGQSLTNSPEQPYSWEQPPEFANPRDALRDVLDSLLQPEPIKKLTQALLKGASVGDIALSVLYTKFFEGKISPDVMLLLVEPLMYVIMSIAEEANIDYNIDNDDIDEPDEEEVEQTISLIQNEFANIRKQIANKKINSTNLEGSVDRSLLNRVKEEGPNIRESLLEKGEEENE